MLKKLLRRIGEYSIRLLRNLMGKRTNTHVESTLKDIKLLTTPDVSSGKNLKNFLKTKEGQLIKAEMTIKAGTEMLIQIAPRVQQSETMPERILMSLALHEFATAVQRSNKIIENLKMPSKSKKIS